MTTLLHRHHTELHLLSTHTVANKHQTAYATRQTEQCFYNAASHRSLASSCRNSSADFPDLVSSAEVVSALNHMKTGTASSYDNIHPEFFKHLGPKAITWLSAFFSSVITERHMPRLWRQANVIALEKPSKDPHLAAN